MYTYILKINLGKTQQKTNIASIVSLLRLTLRYYVLHTILLKSLLETIELQENIIINQFCKSPT